MGEESKPREFKLLTVEDVVKAYASLPSERGELLLKEFGDAVRIMAPLSGLMVSPFLPITWINDTKGKATVGVKSECGEFEASATFNIPKSGA